MVQLDERIRVHDAQGLVLQAEMILDLSLDYHATLPALARVIAGSVADCCLIGLAAHAHGDPFVAAGHVNPDRQPLVAELGTTLALPASDILVGRVLRGGESLLLPSLRRATLERRSVPPHVRELIGALDLTSLVIVPMTVRGASIGFLLLGREKGGAAFDADDRRVAEELGRRIALAVDNARLFQSAELANRAKSDFLAVMSHELRTPLTAVVGYADLLSAKVSGPLNETQQRQVDRIRAASDRLLRLIEAILAFARLETGRDRPVYERASLAGLLARIDEIVRPQALEKGIQFEVTLAGAPSWIVIDSDKFILILLSLLTNAVKFSERGGVELSVRVVDGELCFDVRDTGHGISPQDVTHVFNPFWQADPPTTRRMSGAGLGLSVARRLARLMNGDVVLLDSSPVGSTFRFRLPIGATDLIVR